MKENADGQNFSKSVLERALVVAARQAINNEGTAGESIKRYALIRSWCFDAETELREARYGRSADDEREGRKKNNATRVSDKSYHNGLYEALKMIQDNYDLTTSDRDRVGLAIALYEAKGKL